MKRLEAFRDFLFAMLPACLREPLRMRDDRVRWLAHTEVAPVLARVEKLERAVASVETVAREAANVQLAALVPMLRTLLVRGLILEEDRRAVEDLIATLGGA